MRRMSTSNIADIFVGALVLQVDGGFSGLYLRLWAEGSGNAEQRSPIVRRAIGQLNRHRGIRIELGCAGPQKNVPVG